MISRSIFVRTGMLFAASAMAFPTFADVDLDRYTPSSTLMPYSLYVTDSLYLPAGSSGLSDSGWTGAGRWASFSDGAQLRSPYLTVGGDLAVGNNSGSVRKLNVGGILTTGADLNFTDTATFYQNLSLSALDLRFSGPVYVRGNVNLSGTRQDIAAPVRASGTIAGGSLVAGGSIQAGATLPATLALGQPLRLPGDSLPGAGYLDSVSPGSQNILVTGMRTRRDTAYLTGANGATVQPVEYWHCSKALGVDSVKYCRGDTLLPGSYGTMSIASQRAVLLTEGFYVFDSIDIGSQSALVAAQPRGARTIIQTVRGVGSSGGNSFLGPAGALMAQSFGKDSAQFLGGTLMLVSGRDINMGSDMRLWATLSAPRGNLRFNSQVLLFGQAFGQNSVRSANNMDFGKGAYIPFRVRVPALLASAFQVIETAVGACSDPSGRPCRDTLIKVRLSYVTAYDVRVRWRTAELVPAKARAGLDFRADTGWISIPRKSLEATIRIRIFDDSSYEGAEPFRVVFDSASAAACPDGAGLGDTTIRTCEVRGTIVDDERAPVVRLVSDSAIHEGNSLTRTQSFTVQLFDPNQPDRLLPAKDAPELPVPFRWRTVNGTALVSDRDYQARTPIWDTLSAFSTARKIGVAVVGDTRFERDEWYRVSIDSLVNATLSTRAGDSGWILNDDASPLVTISDSSVVEPAGYGDTAWTVLPVRLDAPSGLPTQVYWHTEDGSAKGTDDFRARPADYLQLSGRLTLLADSIRGTIRIPVFGDTTYEGTERLRLVIDSIVDGRIARSSAVGTIVDADTMPPVFLEDASIREPATGTVQMRLRIHVDRPSSLPASLAWGTSDLSARSGFDYTGVVGDSLQLPAHLRDTVLLVGVLADSIAGEGSETFRVALGSLKGLSAGRLVATGTILDAQDGFRLDIDSLAPVLERDTLVGFLAHLDWYPADTLTLFYHTLPGSAIAGDRYQDTIGSARILPGSRRVLLPVRLLADTLWEPPQYFRVRVDSIHGSKDPVRTDSLANGWITEGRDLVVSYGSADTTVREDSARNLSAWVVLSEPAGVPIRVRLPLQVGSTASIPADLSLVGPAGDTLTIPKGNRRWRLGVPVVADTVLERDEIATFGLVSLDWARVDRPDRWSVQILDDDSIPVVEIQNPPDGLHTKEPRWSIEYTIDKRPQPKVDTIFPSEGWNCVERGVTDRFGRYFSDRNCIWLDLTPPVVHVFKITGPSPHNRRVDTTWWGDLARTRFGKDTIWYWVRDSILAPDGKSWSVKVDTLLALTNWTKDGLHPTEISYCDSVGNCGRDTGWIDLRLRLPKPIRGVYYDRDNDGRIETLVVQLTDAWNSDIVPRFDFGLPPEERRDQRPDSVKPFPEMQGIWDETRFVVPVSPPFRFGATSFSGLKGILWEDWGDTVYADSFPIVDSVAPVILAALIQRTETYGSKDTLWVTPSEPLRLLDGPIHLQVLACPGHRSECKAEDRQWQNVPSTHLQTLPDGRMVFLVPPGETGSIRPQDLLRLTPQVTDTLGNVVANADQIAWKTIVEGAPRPALVQVKAPSGIPQIPAYERDRTGPGGILLQATSGNSDSLRFWDPVHGYLSDADPEVRRICPERRFCAGPELYLNRPVRMIIYLYDNAGTYVDSKTIEITEENLKSLQGDRLDRVRVSLQWNHRTNQGQVVGTGVYIWRIVSYVQLPGRAQPVIQNSLYKVGVEVEGHGGIF